MIETDKEKEKREKWEAKQIKKYGHIPQAIKCTLCGKSGGTLIKERDGKYRHQICHI